MPRLTLFKIVFFLYVHVSCRNKVNLEAANALRFSLPRLSQAFVQTLQMYYKRRNTKKCRPKHYVYFCPRAAWYNQGHGSSSSLASKRTILRISKSPPTGPAIMPYQQLNSMITSIVEQKLATFNSASNSPSSSTCGVVQPTAQQHLPGVTSLAPDPSLPPIRNGGQQQIPSSLDFSLSSSQQDLNLSTPEDAALLHTNYRVPSIASHLSNS